MAHCSRLPEVAATHTNVLHLVLSHLPPDGASRLRNVNRVLRAAVNRSVSTVSCGFIAPRFSSELADVFPQADRLRVELDLETSALAAAQDTALFFDYILAMSPVLATKTRALTLFMHTASTFDSIREAVTSFVSRCTSLQELEVQFKAGDSGFDEHFKLQGQGRTAEERLSNMQQQLAALQSNSSFLAPASWPSTRCLTSVRLDMGSARHDASYLEAAMQAPSLVDLHVFTAEAAPTASILPSVSRLTNLTSLSIQVSDMEDDTPSKPPILEAIAHISRLQSLTIDDWLLGTFVGGEGAGVPPSWAGLTALTMLTVQYGCPDLSSFASLRSLRNLDLGSNGVAVGSILLLLPLTGLTSLNGPEDLPVGDDPEEETAAVVVPRQWREGLVRLDWPTCSGATMGVVSQLTALTRLGLCGVCASFKTCRALGQLRGLQELSLSLNSSVQDTHYSPAVAGMYRPSWPLLTKLRVQVQQPNTLGLYPLHVLARCTDIPTTCTARFLTTATARPLAIKGWGAGWLHAAFTGQGLRHSPVLLVDNGDVAAYIDALGGLDSAQRGFQHTLCLGEAVTPAGFHRLASAPKLPSGSLNIDGALTDAPEPYFIGWSDRLVLKAEHFKSLLSGSSALPHLKSLSISDSSVLADRDVATLATAAPGLQHLWLRNASGLTDAAMYALLGCQQLSVLRVTGAAQLTSSGVLALLALSKALATLVVSCDGSSAVDAVVAAVRRTDPEVAERWCGKYQSRCMVWTKCSA